MKKTGIYICNGCGINENIDTDKLADDIQQDYKPVLVKTNNCLCHQNTLDEIKNDITDYELEDIVVAACSGRNFRKEFLFSEKTRTERVNIREQVAWSHEGDGDEIFSMALDQLIMGITKLAKTKSPVPYLPESISTEILIVGGGISGITAALEADKAGYGVVLVEKETALGGYAAKLSMQYPFEGECNRLIEPEVQFLIEDLQNSSVDVLTSSTVKSVKGEPGNFTVLININQTEKRYSVASIILASGFEPYDPGHLTEYGYDRYDQVVTQPDLEDLVKKNQLTATYPGGLKKVLFVQCAGSRNKNHLPYCSNYCCPTTLKQVRYIRNAFPDSQVFILYKDIRTPGMLEEFYKETQNDDYVFFTKGDISDISQKNGILEISIQNTSLGQNMILGVDLAVLATGMTPLKSDLLNLTYRQGKELPVLKYDFSDSHFICFPYETRRTGIFAAGTCRAPMDISGCKQDAFGAALKAIQCVESTKRGEALHPRAGDRSYPNLYLDRCTDCKRCTEECPFGAYDETEKGTPLPNPARCRRCAICMGSCPERIINFDDFSINSIASMIKSVAIPDEFEEKIRILAFVCENDAYPALDMAGIKRLKFSSSLRIIPVRCIGSVNKSWITDALSHGYDGILMIGCKPGDDYQCHFIKGSELTQTRGENFSEALETMMLEPERVRVETIEINEPEKIVKIMNDYVEEIELIGPNPFKGL